MSNLLDSKFGIELTGNDIDLYKELLQLFLDQTEFDVKKFEELFIKSKENSKSYIHRIKGAARQIGATTLAEKGQFIEDVLNQKQQGSLPYLLNEFCKTYESTIKEVKQFLNNS